MTRKERDLKRQLDQMIVNFYFLYKIIEELHDRFGLPVEGGWKERAKQVGRLEP